MTTHLKANVNLNKEDSIRVLVSEYEQCFEHMRHYNNTSISLTKFAFTGFAAITSGAFALFKYLEGADYQNIVVGGIFLVAFIMAVIVLTLMLRNRLYFVTVARQVNSLRNYFLSSMEMDYLKYNVCYTDPNFPRAFNLWSTYTLLLATVALMSGVLGGVGSYLIVAHCGAVEGWKSWAAGLVVAGVLVIAQFIGSACYLKRYDQPATISEAPPKESPKESANESA